MSIDTNRSFARCKRFEPKVECYQVCPDVNDRGVLRFSSASWRTSC